ncbi:flavin monoamine oxidase family protein [Aliirhizobium smilacinae]|uniref:FAD-dependent oxidoreductase n=1 Tax=Aliirhizobium smilacinae TaxID=1395944 RepID=A0A5C4XJ84_9HYPH|nr:FAD-dependent oxidoreductase [Rhizobium smilacinae]TNM62644.1 FAD-dependent oxidoreductase [Rhizobium smilacinae]
MADHDVIVIGAGFTGLTAAVNLIEAGLDVIIIEARNRVGGRVESEYLPSGIRIDTGGQFLCRDMTHLMETVQRYGARTVFSHVEGEQSYRPAISPERGETIWNAVERLREEMLALDMTDPALARLTVGQWIDRQTEIPADVTGSFRRLVKGLWCRAPEEVALAYLVSNDRRITNVYPELEMFLGDTMHGLAEKLAESLGDRLRLSAPATSITMMEDMAEVDVEGRALTARQVILAVPPVMARRIEISPPLPDQLCKALAAWEPGCAIKLQVGYQRPFWRDRNLSGSVMWSDPQGMYACDASHDTYAGIVVFLGGPLASLWHKKPQAELAAFVTAELAMALGEEAKHPASVNIRDWVNDAWSDGAYSDVITDIDATDAEAVLLQGMPRLNFACSELSPSFPGYVEGAIVAGKNAAQSVLQILRK